MSIITSTRVQKRTWIVAAVVGASVILAMAGIATVGSTDDTQLTGTVLAHASDAALAELGPGTVTDAHRRTAPGPPYAVETRLANGVEVTVELDRSFTVVWVSAPGWLGDVAAGLPARTLDSAEHASLERTSAGQVALAEVGGGTVTGFGRSSAVDHAFEVEVTLANGTKKVIELTQRGEVVRPSRANG
ncbi:hypothetical protein E3O19_05490 [Cryobacterium algoritolerans]|uniref:PepSY domain-containing protein n=1 Tax=Cryobacterium algoritolerans TaxID=1259184 RepID=A0A4R8WY05_9MICO|nr:hypothetical protein [Cryobacterium algoritolerans]TFC17943.1 hypothetical protein E3O19_05490 [Cryobacterium algoritolerans]